MVMGVINITPDSFYSLSRKPDLAGALTLAEKMIAEGAAIIDIGGQSTRPWSRQISAEEELERILPVVEAIAKKFPETFISVDTFYAAVAKKAVEAGASIVNDISGGNLDAEMLPTVASLKVPFICMHIKGTPQTMQQNAVYKNVTREVLDFFIRQIENCRLAGINDVIADPGFGFGKTIAHNFKLLRDLHTFKMLDKPILAGISRKSTIYKTLGITPEQALNGTTVLQTIALLNGASILRTHDVKEAVEALKLVGAYQEA
jgi:dihydropteroate synthase